MNGKLLCSLLLVIGLAAFARAGMTKEEETCAKPFLTKMNTEPDAKLKKILVDAFKLINANKRDAAIAKVGDFNPEQRTRVRDYYMVEECLQFRKMLNME